MTNQPRTIVLFGDSNTWGFNPLDAGRYDAHTRWGGVLRGLLGDGFAVIEEGLNGRTTVHDDRIEVGEARNGLRYLLPCLLSHKPVAALVIALGTNDLKPRFHVDAGDIALGIARLIKAAKTSEAGLAGGSPHILVICPPPTAPLGPTRFNAMFAGAEEKSRRLAAAYRAITAEHDVGFLDAGQVIASSAVDGIHWEPDAHAALAAAVHAHLTGE